MQEISAATEEQAASTQNIVSNVDKVASISKEMNAETETVAAAAEEQTFALTEVSQSADDLVGQAERLSDALERFETNTAIDDKLRPTSIEELSDESTTSETVDPAKIGVTADDLGGDTEPLETPTLTAVLGPDSSSEIDNPSDLAETEDDSDRDRDSIREDNTSGSDSDTTEVKVDDNEDRTGESGSDIFSFGGETSGNE